MQQVYCWFLSHVAVKYFTHNCLELAHPLKVQGQMKSFFFCVIGIDVKRGAIFLKQCWKSSSVSCKRKKCRASLDSNNVAKTVCYIWSLEKSCHNNVIQDSYIKTTTEIRNEKKPLLISHLFYSILTGYRHLQMHPSQLCSTNI